VHAKLLRACCSNVCSAHSVCLRTARYPDRVMMTFSIVPSPKVSDTARRFTDAHVYASFVQVALDVLVDCW